MKGVAYALPRGFLTYALPTTRDEGEYPGHSKNLNYIVSYFFEEHVSKSWDNN